MEITPLQEEILTKLYEKAYKTEPAEENVEKYNEFIGNEKINHMILETEDEALNEYGKYFLPILAFLTWYFWDQISFSNQSPDDMIFLTEIVLFAVGVSLSIGYLNNIKRRRIKMLLKPYFKREEEIKRLAREKSRSEQEQLLIEKENQLRAKYL